MLFNGYLEDKAISLHISWCQNLKLCCGLFGDSQAFSIRGVWLHVLHLYIRVHEWCVFTCIYACAYINMQACGLCVHHIHMCVCLHMCGNSLSRWVGSAVPPHSMSLDQLMNVGNWAPVPNPPSHLRVSPWAYEIIIGNDHIAATFGTYILKNVFCVKISRMTV